MLIYVLVVYFLCSPMVLAVDIGPFSICLSVGLLNPCTGTRVACAGSLVALNYYPGLDICL
jgi:hypothetical protein